MTSSDPVRDSHDILTDPPPAPADARLAYGPEPLQFGDLRLPSREGPFPLAIVLHGGYWRSIYNLIHTGHMCAALAAAGIATWNVEYRRVGDVGGGWPATGDDVFAALAFVDELVARYPLLAERIVVVGHSAGGQLGLTAAKRARLPVVALAPVSDLRESVRRMGGDGAAALFMGGLPDEVPDRYSDASPLEQLPLGVPQVVIHGTADESVPYEMSERYVEEAGGEAELIPLERAGHFELIDPQSHEWPRVLAAIQRALEEQRSPSPR